MSRAVTSLSHAERIARVIEALHAEPERVWRLDDLAGIACFSPFHFHRIYRATTGETPEDTRRRLLLQRAAFDLINSARDVARIAQRAGYGSAAAFTRAFAAAYGAPPATWRAQREERPPPFQNHPEPGDDAMTPYAVTIGEEKPRRLVGLAYRGDYLAIGQAFERLGAYIPRLPLAADAKMVGVYYDDPDSTPEHERRAFAALEARAGAQAPEGFEMRDLPGGAVASVIHKGPYAELHRAYRHLYRDWLPTSGREPEDSPAYEIYLNDPRLVAPTEWLTKVVMPIRA